MPAPSKLITLLPVLAASSQKNTDQISPFSNKLEAFQFLYDNPGHKLQHRTKRSNEGYFEEFSPPDLKTECVEEVCNKEEISEIVGGKTADRDKLFNALAKSCTNGGEVISEYLKETDDQKATRVACDTRRTLRCTQHFASHICDCLPGWVGPSCQEMEDVCASGESIGITSPNSICPPGYECINEPRSGRNPQDQSKDIGFSCKLKPGFAEDHDETKMVQKIYEIMRLQGLEKEKITVTKSFYRASDIDECASDSTNVCSTLENRHCNNRDSGYYCECNSGYREDFVPETLTNEDISNMNANPSKEYPSCQDINECSDRPNICDNQLNTECANIDGGYNCKCISGYAVKNGGAGDTGQTCEDINECNAHDISDEFNCLNCQNNEGSYDVSCNYGTPVQVDNGDSDSITYECLDINECEVNSHSCPVNSYCVNIDSMQDQCQTGRDAFKDKSSPWWGYTCECEHPYTMQNHECVLCNWDYINTQIITDLPDHEKLTDPEDQNAEFEQICEKYRNENIGFCLANGNDGFTITRTRSADDCQCKDENNPNGDASKVDDNNCNSETKSVTDFFTCPCDYAKCDFVPEDTNNVQCEVEDAITVCSSDASNEDNGFKVSGFKKFFEVCTCPDGNDGQCSRLEEEIPSYSEDDDEVIYETKTYDNQEGSGNELNIGEDDYETDDTYVENSTEIVEEISDENDETDSESDDGEYYYQDYEEDDDDDNEDDDSNDSEQRGDANNVRKKRGSESEESPEDYDYDNDMSAAEEKPKFLSHMAGTRLEIRSQREKCSFQCPLKQKVPECTENEIYSEWVGEGPCLDINDNEATCGDAWRKTTRKCKCGPCKEFCDESKLESDDPTDKNCKYQLANEHWPETCPTTPSPPNDEACEYGEYEEEDTLEVIEVEGKLESLSPVDDDVDYVEDDYNNSK